MKIKLASIQGESVTKHICYFPYVGKTGLTMDLSRNRSPTVCLGQEKELKRSNIFRLTQLRHHHDCGFPIKMTK